MSRISRADTHGKLFAVSRVIALILLAGCICQFSAFASELTIYSSEGMQKISIPEPEGPQKTRDNYRLVGEKCILNCEEEVSKSQPTDKMPAKEASDSTEKQGQSVTINVYPNEPTQNPYIFIPYRRPHGDRRPSDRPKPPLRPSINPRTSGISDSPIPK
jgi:hypothetical protein